ncbi:60S ribosomal protein L28 [Trichonephila inaurata madagascariensis]|uniref:Large ribosomal subunit protein eL28 n=1 Tax=Trichonephila inaurata madagascariensis TaxID=2747483 RepID=A0A8X7BWE7_9ARAC|nr:60S ribosomal protein L28 [Trichonephila inaurata madagascariensis]
MIVRNRSSFLVKKKNIKVPFSTDPFNMKKLHTARFSGSIHDNAVMIEPHPSKKGVRFIHKRKNLGNKPAKSLGVQNFTKHSRKTMINVKNFFRKTGYRKDLKMLALRTASKIYRCQRPIVPKKKVFKKKPE